MNVSAISQNIAQEIVEASHEDLAAGISKELIGSQSLLSDIKNKIREFIDIVEKYDNPSKGAGTIGQHLANLRNQKEFIYSKFFEIQNLINAFLGQRIVMTYVHVDDITGRREIRISDNDISHLDIQYGQSKGGNPFYKLGYNMDMHYQTLKNSLPEKDNLALQVTAAEVERRYKTYKKRVLWYWNNKWKGYQFRTRGPINEAFVNMYVHNVILQNSLEGNIDRFILDEDYGARKADATKGFLIGDVRKDGVQYAVKGKFSSPQGRRLIIKEFKKMLNEDFSEKSFYDFINKYTYDELNKNYKPQITELSQETIKSIFEGMPEKVDLTQNF